MIGIVSVTGNARMVRVALLSHAWTDFHTVQHTQEWGGLAAAGYCYAAAEHAFLKDCAGQDSATAPGVLADLATRRRQCQAALDVITQLPDIGMYTRVVTRLAGRGLIWRGRCLTTQDVLAALDPPPALS